MLKRLPHLAATLLLAGLIAALLSWWLNEERRFVQVLAPASREVALGSTLDLARVYPEPWQRLYIFPPYSAIATMEAAMQLKANRALKAAHLEERDDIALFVFVEGREIQLVAEVRRGIMEVELSGDFLVRDRAHAQFKKTQKPGSVAWVAQP